MQSKAKISMTLSYMSWVPAMAKTQIKNYKSHSRVVWFFFYFKNTETFKIIKTEKPLESL